MKLKKISSIILTFIMCFCVLNFAFADEAEEIPDGYTPIYTAEDLNDIRNNLSGKYILMNHIDLSEYGEWESVGGYDNPFSGELNGGGYSITGLTGEESLLGKTENATIRNLGIVNCRIVQPEETAGSSAVAGSFAETAINSTFDGCFAAGEIQECIRVGFIGSIPMCSIGGIAGKVQGSEFVNCYSDIDIYFTYNELFSGMLGGLAGDCYNSHFEYCYGISTISSKQSDVFSEESQNVYAGGLIGSENESCIFENCYYQDNVDFASGKEKTNPVGTKKLSESQMKNIQSYEGFDFENTWKIAEGSYPALRTAKSVLNKDITINYKDKADMFFYGNAETVEWSSENEDVAVVTENGKIQGTGTGTTTITVKTSDDQTEKINVTVSYSFWQKIIVYLFFGWIWY